MTTGEKLIVIAARALKEIMEEHPPMDKAIVMGDVVRRIAAETVPRSEKEWLAIKLASFVLGMHADCLQKLVKEEREAAGHIETTLTSFRSKFLGDN